MSDFLIVLWGLRQAFSKALMSNIQLAPEQQTYPTLMTLDDGQRLGSLRQAQVSHRNASYSGDKRDSSLQPPGNKGRL